MNFPAKEDITEKLKLIQKHIISEIERCDGRGKFISDSWSRPGGGGGNTCVLQNGEVLEKAGVNFSAVHGKLPTTISKEFRVDSDTDFYATGVSIVMHPTNPWIPIIHMNIRYFEMGEGAYWFGGGIDLTPHYIDKKQAKYFHNELKKVCDAFDKSYYATFKKEADQYFFNKHRNETRGIGGIFFDHLRANETASKKQIFDFLIAVGEFFPKIYTYLINENRNKSFTQENKNWQLLRRGRYVEFNLVYDKGTKFGLETSGRIESILMSLPAQANWEYNHVPLENSEEAFTLNLLKKDIEWLELE
jgi:coproporphyrinogen III oxidase